MSILACCLTGFGLQTAEFLDNFYKYPVVVSLDYQSLKEFPMPAYTYCSKYWYDFKKYCQDFPDNCETFEHTENFCNSYPLACQGNATHSIVPMTFPNEEFHKEILRKLAYNSSTVFVLGADTKIIRGPIFTEIDGVMECCFTCNNGFGSNGLRKTGKENFTSSRLVSEEWLIVNFIPFDLLPEFFFKPEAAPYGTVYVHSPLLAFRTDDKSFIFKAGKTYVMSVRLSMKRLLPHPYETDCRDYELSWKKNNNTGPVSREMCESLCVNLNQSYFERNFIAAISMFDFCKPIMNGSEVIKKPYWSAREIKTCKCVVNNCKKDCCVKRSAMKIAKHYNYYQSDDERIVQAGLRVRFEKDDVPTTFLKPKYENCKDNGVVV
ncbi:hypothetical protein JTE90_012469 [Oedothorax gibbosus]|uniref:Uncharacterized protein n=1 Tax=Oedothorax gibbosus TaxID=931172 RepID=A0AAV6UEE0_9ARAC|nr:hypothetical protein JTE90_012469 [Oedothorax gibbosus]